MRLAMMVVQRDFVEVLSQRFQENAPLIQIVIGPRQVGKTTGILQFLEQFEGAYHYASSDSVLTTSQDWLIEQWQAALLKGANSLLVIDEIQKIPGWPEIIKKLWDEQRLKKHAVKVLLSGSSSLSLSEGLSDSLAGRFEVLSVYHWDYCESNQLVKLSVNDYLCYGGYPKSYDFLQEEDRWRTYLQNAVIDRVIDKDILQHVNIKKPALFRQTFELASCYPAQEISYRKLLGQLQDKGNTDLIKYYLTLLEDAFLIKTLQKYQNREFKTKSSSPKIVLLAPCFYYLLSPKGDKYTFVFENTIGAKLLQISSQLYYWREDQYEVDFVMIWRHQLLAIEVKSGRKKKAYGLQRFQALHPDAKPVIISSDNYEQFIQNPVGFLEALV